MEDTSLKLYSTLQATTLASSGIRSSLPLFKEPVVSWSAPFTSVCENKDPADEAETDGTAEAAGLVVRCVRKSVPYNSRQMFAKFRKNIAEEELTSVSSRSFHVKCLQNSGRISPRRN